MARVSFVVTNHNYARFLPQALDSLLNQSFTDLELIVVDDCSTDNSAEVLARYARNPRVRIVQHTTNTGSIRAYNEGLQMAVGEYIGVFDADDYALDPHAVARQVALFDANPEVGLVYSGFDQVDEYSQPFRACRPFASDYVRDGLAEFSDLIFLNYIAHSGTLVRRTCHEALGYYDLRLPYAGDWELWLRVAARYAVGYVADPLYAYRVHINNMTAKGKSPSEATGERLMAVSRAFASLPADAPAAVRELQPAAVRKALLCGSWNDRSLGRLSRSWAGLADAVRRSPALLARPEPYVAGAKLVVLAAVGHKRYEKLSASRTGATI